MKNYETVERYKTFDNKVFKTPKKAVEHVDNIFAEYLSELVKGRLLSARDEYTLISILVDNKEGVAAQLFKILDVERG